VINEPKGCWFESNRGSLTRDFTLSRSLHPCLPLFRSDLDGSQAMP
jgi:hypothetical protein